MQNESDLRAAMEAAIVAYAPLGYKPARWMAEPVMVKGPVGFVLEEPC